MRKNRSCLKRRCLKLGLMIGLIFCATLANRGIPYPLGGYGPAAQANQTGKQDYSGSVAQIKNGEITVDTGSQLIQVDTERLSHNPLDQLGGDKIDIGDRVMVFGYVGFDPKEGKEVKADLVFKLK